MSNVVDVTGDGGVMKEILKEGTGSETPKSGDEVKVHYVGTLLDGTKFDSSRDRNDPFVFKLDSQQVIKGWDKCVATMKKGEHCRVTLKPDYAYGKAGSPPKIPQDATLLFEIELLSWDDEKDITKQKDGGILKKVLVETEKWEVPNYEANCIINITVRGSNDHVYEESVGKRVIIGTSDIPRGLQLSLESMKKGERALFKVRSDYAYGTEGNKEHNIPPNTDLVFDITLIELEKGKEAWQISAFDDKLSVALRRKNEGNDLLGNNKIFLAVKKYEKAIDLFKNATLSEEEKKKVKEVQLACHLNLAAAHIKEKNWKGAIEQSTKALDIDASNVKGFWRRGTANTGLSEYQQAQRDFESALQLDPDNQSVKTSLANLKKRMQLADKKDKKRFENLFERLREEESKEKSATTTTTQEQPKPEEEKKSEDKPVEDKH